MQNLESHLFQFLYLWSLFPQTSITKSITSGEKKSKHVQLKRHLLVNKAIFIHNIYKKMYKKHYIQIYVIPMYYLSDPAYLTI